MPQNRKTRKASKKRTALRTKTRRMKNKPSNGGGFFFRTKKQKLRALAIKLNRNIEKSYKKIERAETDLEKEVLYHEKRVDDRRGGVGHIRWLDTELPKKRHALQKLKYETYSNIETLKSKLREVETELSEPSQRPGLRRSESLV